MIIKINKQLRDEVGSKGVLAKTISDHVGISIKDAKEIVDSLDGDQMCAVPEGFTDEECEILFSILYEKDLYPEYVKDEDETNKEDENPDKLGVCINATEMGVIVTVRIRVDKEASGQLKSVLHDAGMSSVLEIESKESEDLSVISVSNNFGSDVNILCITNYVADILRFRDSVNIEYTLRKIRDKFGIKRTLEEYKRSL